MDNSNKKSNKIRDIVRLQQILKKWRKQASSSSSSSLKPTNSNNKSINKFLKRTLSFSESPSAFSSNSNVVVVPKKGYLAVSVGEEMKRFIIPTEYLGHKAFHVLLREAEEEFGFQQGAGLLRIPCEVGVFETILKVVEDKNINKKQILLFDDPSISSPSSSPLLFCSSSSSSSSSSLHHQTPSHHHPQSPMCR